MKIELYLTKPEATVMYAWVINYFSKSRPMLVNKFRQRYGTFILTLEEFEVIYDTYMLQGVNERIKNKLSLINSKILEKA